MTVADEHVELWTVRRDDLPGDVLDRFAAWLTAEEAERQLRYRRPVDQKRFLVGRGLLRALLQHHARRAADQWTFGIDAYGRPSAVDPPPDAPAFSLSHTRGVTLCAVSARGPLGADIEALDSSRHWQISKRFFAPDEAALVRDAAEAERGGVFLRIWTLKESYIKALGRGLSIPLDSFCFVLHDTQPPRLQDPRADAGWHFFERQVEGTRAAVAVRAGRRPRLVCHDFTSQAGRLVL